MGPLPKTKLHPGLRKIHVQTEVLRAGSSRCSSMNRLTPGGLRRLKEKTNSETVRVLNVEPMEEDAAEDSSVPVGYVSSSFDMPLPAFGSMEDWVDDDDASYDEARQVYEDLVQGIRRM